MIIKALINFFLVFFLESIAILGSLVAVSFLNTSAFLSTLFRSHHKHKVEDIYQLYCPLMINIDTLKDNLGSI